MKDLFAGAVPGYKTRKDFWVRLIFSIIAGIFITRFGQSVSFMAMFILPAHQYALVSSIVIAYLLFESVYRITLLGDAKLNWTQYPLIRFGFQFIIGWGGGCLLAFLLAKFYYQYAGYDILKSGYLKHLFPMIVVYLAAINMYYCWDKISAELTPFLKKATAPEQTITIPEPVIEEIIAQPAAETIAVKSATKEFIRTYVIENDLICINIKNKSIFAWNSKNQTVKWAPATIADSMSILPPELYVQIKRDAIVLASAIEKIEEKEDKKLYIHLKGQPAAFHLSKERINDFIAFGRTYEMKWANAEALK